MSSINLCNVKIKTTDDRLTKVVNYGDELISWNTTTLIFEFDSSFLPILENRFENHFDEKLNYTIIE
jgi:hypothetical protein